MGRRHGGDGLRLASTRGVYLAAETTVAILKAVALIGLLAVWLEFLPSLGRFGKKLTRAIASMDRMVLGDCKSENDRANDLLSSQFEESDNAQQDRRQSPAPVYQPGLLILKGKASVLSRKDKIPRRA